MDIDIAGGQELMETLEQPIPENPLNAWGAGLFTNILQRTTPLLSIYTGRGTLQGDL